MKKEIPIQKTTVRQRKRNGIQFVKITMKQKNQVKMKSNFNTIIDSKTPVLIDFYAEWCGPCKSLMPVLEQVKLDLDPLIKIFKIDVDKNPLLAANYQIKGVPTLLLFKDGMQVWRQSGMIQKNDLVNVIKSN